MGDLAVAAVRQIARNGEIRQTQFDGRPFKQHQFSSTASNPFQMGMFMVIGRWDSRILAIAKLSESKKRIQTTAKDRTIRKFSVRVFTATWMWCLNGSARQFSPAGRAGEYSAVPRGSEIQRLQQSRFLNPVPERAILLPSDRC